MEKHRVRTAKPIDNEPEKHIFIEVEPDRWLEVTLKTYVGASHRDIHNWLVLDAVAGVHPLDYATRAFSGGIIRDWKEMGPIA